jgi:excinuclease ABC subunit C
MGYTQLLRATEAAVALELPELAMIGLAKKREEIYFPGEKIPVQFDINSPAIRLLRQLRDEAHRFGVSFHRVRRNKKTMQNILHGIPEIGITKRKAIIQFLSGSKKISQITLDELKSIHGIGEKTALKIYNTIKGSKV